MQRNWSRQENFFTPKSPWYLATQRRKIGAGMKSITYAIIDRSIYICVPPQGFTEDLFRKGIGFQVDHDCFVTFFIIIRDVMRCLVKFYRTLVNNSSVSTKCLLVSSLIVVKTLTIVLRQTMLDKKDYESRDTPG